MLVAEGLGKHIEKGYAYFAMAFSFAVEMINIRHAKSSPVALRGPHRRTEHGQPRRLLWRERHDEWHAHSRSVAR
jgi:predicted tellurium resistance membrane protein TerC